MYHTEGENIISEVNPLNDGKIVKIYISKKNKKYSQSCKCFGTHYLEQTFDNKGNLIKEIIKENPYFIKSSLPDGHGSSFI